MNEVYTSLDENLLLTFFAIGTVYGQPRSELF